MKKIICLILGHDWDFLDDVATTGSNLFGVWQCERCRKVELD